VKRQTCPDLVEVSVAGFWGPNRVLICGLVFESERLVLGVPAALKGIEAFQSTSCQPHRVGPSRINSTIIGAKNAKGSTLLTSVSWTFSPLAIARTDDTSPELNCSNQRLACASRRQRCGSGVPVAVFPPGITIRPSTPRRRIWNGKSSRIASLFEGPPWFRSAPNRLASSDPSTLMLNVPEAISTRSTRSWSISFLPCDLFHLGGRR
jgi:hypothetical protein